MARQLMTVEQILSVLRDTPGRLSGLAGELTEAKLHTAPEPGEWSVTEIAAHLRSCADVWGAAIETIIATDHPTIRAVSPATWIKSTDYRELAFASSWQAFSKQRDQLLALLGQLPEQGWSRTATVLGGGRPLELTVHSYANRLARHERTHWRQVTKTVRALLDLPAQTVFGHVER
jgi:DinB superfamily